MNYGMIACSCSVIALLSAVLSSWYKLLLNCEHRVSKEKQSYQIVFGILSARENFQLRAALRKTWIRLLMQYSSLEGRNRFAYKFVVGSNGCEIPVEDRINEYSCEWDPYIATNQDGEIAAYRIGENSLIDFQKEAVGLDFEVMHSIVITKLGILAIDRIHNIHTALRISIFDTVHKREVISTTFHEHASDGKYGFWFKIVDDLVLPKEFKGTLLVEGNGLEFMVAKSNGSCFINDGGGLIKFKKIIRLGVLTGLYPSDAEDSISFCSILAGTFVYRPYGLENHSPGYSALQVHKRLDRIDALRKQLRQQMELIGREMEDNGDILLLNLTDVYRNVPFKLLLFHEWIDDHFDFNVLVKTDDDCYLNVPSILKLLETRKVNRNEIWWHGNFRFDWPLDKFGKWAELEYSGSVYPAFACGSGYILSKEVVKWIALNSKYLHCYQGEDVSMGIWLAALNPRLERDKRWTCFKICSKDMLSLPNNSPEELVSLFSNETQCHNPCGCTR